MKRVFKFAALAAIVAGVVGMKKKMEQQWMSMSEEELRSKVHAKMEGRVPAEKGSMIEDKIVEAHRKVQERRNGHMTADV